MLAGVAHDGIEDWATGLRGYPSESNRKEVLYLKEFGVKLGAALLK